MFMYVDSVWCLFFIYVYEYELDGVVMNYIKDICICICFVFFIVIFRVGFYDFIRLG